jgi:hypothetical protein
MAGASRTDAVRELCSGCTAIWFLGSVRASAYFDDDDDVSQLSATTTLLRRRHGRSVEFIHRRYWISASISSVYLLVLFLPVLQYVCLDVLQSSFKYACLECVTFKLSICVYVIDIIMSNNFWINIMRKLSKFLKATAHQVGTGRVAAWARRTPPPSRSLQARPGLSAHGQSPASPILGLYGLMSIGYCCSM